MKADAARQATLLRCPPTQLDLFEALEEKQRDAEVVPFPKTEAARAISAALERRNARNFVIGRELDDIGPRKQRFADNVAAIKALRCITAENRSPSDEEKRLLVRYTGWGALPSVFDTTQGCKDPQWRDELRALLAEDEYNAARASVNNAHFTSPMVVRFIWQALQHMGFTGGRIIEPSAGVGHFLGCMPAEVAATSRLFAVEIDSISAGITQALYPDATVYANGFQSITFPAGSFDLAISNVPFGKYRVPDTRYDKLRLPIHDYFFAKSLDLVRPGGIVAFITSHFTMDKVRSSFREYMAARAQLIAAVRLPTGTFSQIAGTEVITDIVFLQKRDRLIAQKDIEQCDWVAIDEASEALWRTYAKPLWINAHWNAHPERVLGTLSAKYGYQGSQLECTLEGDLGVKLAEVAKELPRAVYTAPSPQDLASRERSRGSAIPAPGAIKPGGYGVIDGVLARNEAGLMEPVEGQLATKTVERIKGILAVRDCARDVLRKGLEGGDGSAERAALNRVYDAFAAEHGPLWSRANRLAMKGDPDLPLVLSLEYWDEDRGVAQKAEIFTVCTVSSAELADGAENLTEAIALSLNRYGELQLDAIGRWLGKRTVSVEEALVEDDLAFNDPGLNAWVMRDEYLSGDVREKLAIAETAARADPSLDRNVEALKLVIPKDLMPEEIDARLGASWIPTQDLQRFAKELLEEDVTISFSEEVAAWQLESNPYTVEHNVLCTEKWGTPEMSATVLLSHALNQRTPTVYESVRDAKGQERRVVNQEETLAARDKWFGIREQFKQWIWKDDSRRIRLARLYNDLYNTTVDRVFDGSHLVLPGANPAIVLRPSQKNAIWRTLVSGTNTLLAHAVGAGKTMIMAASAMEAKRLGLCTKPLFTVPNHMLEQFAAEFLRLYPQANILAASKDDLAGDKRKTLLARIATGNWDGVIVTHSSFEKLALSDACIKSFIEAQETCLEEAIRKVQATMESGNTRLVKRIELAKKQLVAKLETMLGRHRKDGGLDFEQLGIDWLSVDEAHLFKNLHFVTKMDRVAGLPQVSSLRAFDLLLKTQAVREARGDKRGVVFATATPIANALAELYTMQRYLQIERLQKLGLDQFDNWAANFGETITSVELAPDGGGYRMHTRFARYVNLPELMALFREVADIQTKETLNLPEPKLEGEAHQVRKAPASDALKDFVAELVARAEKIRSSDPSERPDPSEDNMLMVTNDGRKAALDMRLVDPGAKDEPASKLNEAVREMHVIWHESRDRRLTQLVFCDLSVPTKNGVFSVYNDIRDKLVAMGIPEKEIAFIQDANSDQAKASLFRKVREGKVRILLGSTSKMGIGTNVQDLLFAEHHLDAPWRPADVEQRDGRILRQGNLNEQVRILRYVTEGSFDAYMWQALETKARFIAQVMSGRTGVRSMEEVELAALSYAEVKAIASGNPMVLEKAGVDAEVARLATLKRVWSKRQYEMRWRFHDIEHQCESLERAAKRADNDADAASKAGLMTLVLRDGSEVSERDAIGKAIILGMERARRLPTRAELEIGHFGPFTLQAVHLLAEHVEVSIVREGEYTLNEIRTISGALTVLENAVRRIPTLGPSRRQAAENLRLERHSIERELGKGFEHEERLATLCDRQRELDDALGITANQATQLAA